MPPPISDEPDSSLGWWALGLVGLCALVVVGLASWAGYLDRLYQAREGLPPAAANSADHPIDHDVTVSGKVQQIVSPKEFTITDTDRRGQDLRVVTDTAEALHVGTPVRVTGRIQTSSPEKASRDDRWRDEPVLHATHIEVAGELPR